MSLVASSFVGFRSVVARRLSWVWLSSDGAWHVWLSLVTAVEFGRDEVRPVKSSHGN